MKGSRPGLAPVTSRVLPATDPQWCYPMLCFLAFKPPLGRRHRLGLLGVRTDVGSWDGFLVREGRLGWRVAKAASIGMC
jgi:hypothetical protein